MNVLQPQDITEAKRSLGGKVSWTLHQHPWPQSVQRCQTDPQPSRLLFHLVQQLLPKKLKTRSRSDEPSSNFSCVPTDWYCRNSGDYLQPWRKHIVDQTSSSSVTGVLLGRIRSHSMKEGENSPSSPTYTFSEIKKNVPIHSC